ncbi:hypothetical protein MNV49_007654 [Pseudohyphozyma bogoriensis]|nr:hypothetical protein MNV49_007654 [Pseudohyphozyma bogoriensis]
MSCAQTCISPTSAALIALGAVIGVDGLLLAVYLIRECVRRRKKRRREVDVEKMRRLRKLEERKSPIHVNEDPRRWRMDQREEGWERLEEGQRNASGGRGRGGGLPEVGRLPTPGSPPSSGPDTFAGAQAKSQQSHATYTTYDSRAELVPKVVKSAPANSQSFYSVAVTSSLQNPTLYDPPQHTNPPKLRPIQTNFSSNSPTSPILSRFQSLRNVHSAREGRCSAFTNA